MKLVALLLLVVAACSSSGDDDDAARETKPADTAPPSTEPASTVSATVDTSSPATSAPSAASDVAADLSGALGLAIGTGNFVEPEPECFDDAYAALPVSARRTVLAVEEDPLSWPASVDRDGANEVLSAYLGCVEPERLRQWLVLSVLQVLDEQECVSAAWEDLVTPDAVASSVAYGDGLDDLDPALVDQLTATAAACVPDRQWWIDDVAIDLEGDDLTADEASCVAIAYVDVLGVNEVIRRRILTIPLLAVPSADEERLDLQRRCGVSPVVQLAQLDAPVGTCLTGFGSGADSTEVIDCAATHNAEVIAVHDLGAEYATWPGMQMLRDKTITQCPADVEALPVDAVDYIAGWDMPDRASWEQAARTLTCTLVRPGFASWTGPSDVALPAPTTTAPANVGQEVLDIDTLAVGQCLQRPDALPGRTDEERPLFISRCDSPHHEEVFHVFELDVAGTPFPGDDAVTTRADQGCFDAFGPYVGVPYDESRLFYSYYWPNQVVWDSGSRLVQCVLHNEDLDEVLTASMAGSGE